MPSLVAGRRCRCNAGGVGRSNRDVTLEALKLVRNYGGRVAVRDVSFTAEPGDVVGLLGPNGAGKTTTIRLLTTVLAPTSGSFRVAGHPSTAPAEIRRRIGVLPESGGYPRHQTGRAYLSYFARLHGVERSAARRLADRLLADVGLAERAESPIATYSRGMRRRLGIARALVNDPAVVFLDEPTLGLDPAGALQVLGIVRRLAREHGTTVVISTHDLPEVEQICSKVLILDRGRVLTSGSVDDVVATAMVERSARLRVPIEWVEPARVALERVPGLTVDRRDGPPDEIKIMISATGAAPGPGALNAALAAVVASGAPVLSFDVDGARLSDAYFSMTRQPGQVSKTA